MIPIEAGAAAPFSGFLFPIGRALKMGAKLEACQFRLKLDRDLFGQTLDLRMGAVKDAAAIRIEGAEARAEIALQALADYKATNAREWWDQPTLLFWAGIAAGAAAAALGGAGSVLAVGYLRPAIPPAE